MQQPNEKDKRVLDYNVAHQEETANEPLTEMERQHNKKKKKRQ